MNITAADQLLIWKAFKTSWITHLHQVKGQNLNYIFKKTLSFILYYKHQIEKFPFDDCSGTRNLL